MLKRWETEKQQTLQKWIDDTYPVKEHVFLKLSVMFIIILHTLLIVK